MTSIVRNSKPAWSTRNFEFPGELQEVFGEAQSSWSWPANSSRSGTNKSLIISRGFDPGRRGGHRIGHQPPARTAATRRHSEIVSEECSAASRAGDQRVPSAHASVGVSGQRSRRVSATFGTTALGEEYGDVNQEDREFEGAKQLCPASQPILSATRSPHRRAPTRASDGQDRPS